MNEFILIGWSWLPYPVQQFIVALLGFGAIFAPAFIFYLMAEYRPSKPVVRYTCSRCGNWVEFERQKPLPFDRVRLLINTPNRRWKMRNELGWKIFTGLLRNKHYCIECRDVKNECARRDMSRPDIVTRGKCEVKK